jgi:signal transduction histidine kinase
MGYVGISRDITERKRYEMALQALNETLEERVAERTMELERSNRELDQFAYVASHDLKAPLRAIGTLASWIAADAAAVLPEASLGHLTRLQGRIARMDALLDDLLAYSRAGRVRHPLEWVDMAGLVHDVVDLLAPPPGLVVHVDAGMPSLLAERVPLETVFRNLIGNAIKHHHDPARGNITISARRLGAWTEFRVADDGPGIDPAFHERIFAMFQTLRPRDQVEGSGIGLTLVKKLVEMRGGKVTLESSPGHGATFCFTWPVAAED